MAAPVNTYTSTAMVGIREDLSDAIYNIDPDEVPFLTKCARIKVSQFLTEWQTESLRASADNAHIEGDDTIANPIDPTVRLSNRIQLFKDSIAVTGSDTYIKKAGRGKELQHQIKKTVKEHRLDIERALFLNQPRVTGSSVTPARLAGVPTWLTTNTVFESGSSGADPTGDGSDARTDDGTPVAFSQTRFNTVMQRRWENGGKMSGICVYLTAGHMNTALAFTGNNNQRATIDASSGRVVNNMKAYTTPWGDVKFVMSREHRTRDVLILQDDMWKVGHMRMGKTEQLAKTGDSDKVQLLSDVTLICCNEKASGAVYDNTVA